MLLCAAAGTPLIADDQLMRVHTYLPNSTVVLPIQNDCDTPASCLAAAGRMPNDEQELLVWHVTRLRRLLVDTNVDCISRLLQGLEEWQPAQVV